jgi:lipooligosaccharide transport system permease protein
VGCVEDLPAEAGDVTSTALGFRVVPPALIGLTRGRRLIERNVRVFRKTWWVFMSGFAEPAFYLLSIGIGIGKLVGGMPGPHHTIVPYATYVAPALLASSAMNGAVIESTYNVYFKIKFSRVYDAVLASPMDARDVALGDIVTALLRGSVYAAVFVVMMAALGDVNSWWTVFALPAAVLVGFAFAAVGMAATTYMRGWTDFDFVNLALLPMFLFSTTFYPLSAFPRWLQILVECTPLYHGVGLIRALTLGDVGVAAMVHVGYLVAMGAIGVTVASRRIRVLLLS